MTSCDEDEDNHMNSVTSIDAARDNPIHNTFTVGSFFLILIHPDLCSTAPTRETERTS